MQFNLNIKNLHAPFRYDLNFIKYAELSQLNIMKMVDAKEER